MRNSEITSQRIAQDMNRALYVERCCQSLGICLAEFIVAEREADRVPDFIRTTDANSVQGTAPDRHA